MKIDPRHLEMLAAIVERGGLGEGAGALNKSQPSVSRSLQLLQERVGIPLFVANRKPLVPTQFCRKLAAEGQKIARAGEVVSQLVTSARQGESGSVRVAGTPFFMDGVVSSMLARFQAEFPGVSIEQAYGYADDILAKLENGMSDLGILPVRESEIPDGLAHVKILHGRNVIACRAGHGLCARKSVRLSDIASYPWIAPPAGSPLYHDLRAALDSIGMTNFKISFCGGTLSSVINILCESDSLTVLPYSVVFAMRRRQMLRSLPVRIGDPARNLYVIFPHNALHNRTIKRLLAFIGHEFKNLEALMLFRKQENMWRS